MNVLVQFAAPVLRKQSVGEARARSTAYYCYYDYMTVTTSTTITIITIVTMVSSNVIIIVT